MHNQRIHRVLAFSLAILVFFSSMGIAADFHFCKGEFKNFALYKKAKSCHELANMPGCHKTAKKCSKASITCGTDDEDGCCTNNMAYLQLDIDFSFGSSAHESSNIYTPKLLAANPYALLSKDKISNNVIEYLNYKPPLLEKPVHILYQVFLC